jgi:hypothetical protein
LTLTGKDSESRSTLLPGGNPRQFTLNLNPPRTKTAMADQSKSQVAANLKALQKQLNTNTRSRNAFLDDPAGVLARQGIDLPAARAKALKSFIEKQTNIPEGQVVGATIRPGASRLKTEVEVTVKVKF